MAKFKLTWSDDVKATYPGVTTRAGKHSYEFETESKEDAMKFVQSFAKINPQHYFADYKLTEVPKK